MDLVLGVLSLLSLFLVLWQWMVARQQPLNHDPAPTPTAFTPNASLLKPLLGFDSYTRECLLSWFNQIYSGQWEILFGVSDPQDPVCEIVQELIKTNPYVNARLIVCSEKYGPNEKATKLAAMEKRARHPVLVVSDADTWVPPDLLTQIVQPLVKEQTGLVHCFYRLALQPSLPSQWEAVSTNADFWSQVLQRQSIKPIDFALGATLALRREVLQQAGGFEAVTAYLADDYQLGKHICALGKSIVFCNRVVECRNEVTTWRAAWEHQLRWATTVRVCEPIPYFFSILNNVTFWNLAWTFWSGYGFALFVSATSLILRAAAAHHQQCRILGHCPPWHHAWLIWLKDLLQLLLWGISLFKKTVVWQGKIHRITRHGRLLLGANQK